jgi:hypothetical protein
VSALRIAGTLVGRAYTSASPKDEAFVHLQLHQGGDSLPLRAARSIGFGPAAHYAARNTAAHLHAGMHVTVHADHLELRRKPEPHLLIVGVDRVDQPIPTNPLEPKEATAP